MFGVAAGGRRDRLRHRYALDVLARYGGHTRGRDGPRVRSRSTARVKPVTTLSSGAVKKTGVMVGVVMVIGSVLAFSVPRCPGPRGDLQIPPRFP